MKPAGVVTFPGPDDVAGWQAHAAAMDALVAGFVGAVSLPESLTLRTDFVGEVPVHVLVPAEVDEASAPIVIDIDGGGLISGGGDASWKLAIGRAMAHRAVTWVPDYRMPPEHRYPAALDDVVATYRAALALRAPSQIAVLGSSAGGNLAAALVHRLVDEGIPAPAGLVLLTPELDLTESGDTFTTLFGLDILSPMRPVNEMYADGADLAHPYLSPLFGDVTGFPPTFLSSGTRDLFLSNTVRMHRRLLDARVPVELRITEAGPHGGFAGMAPEDAVLGRDVAEYLGAILDWGTPA